MVRDVLKEAAEMLNLKEEAAALATADGTDGTAAEFLRLYNLVVGEICDEYRRTDYAEPPLAAGLDDAEAEFYGVSPRVLAYGVAAEYCITQGLDEAVTWDGRYKAGLALAARPRVKIRARRMY